MPEVAIDENSNAGLGEDEIGRTGKIPDMPFGIVARPSESFGHHLFRFGVLALDSAHEGRSFFR